MSTIIQRSIYPSIELCSEVQMFFRCLTNAIISLEEQSIKLFRGGKLDTSTYFNGMSVNKWKKLTTLKQLSFSLSFVGHIQLSFRLLTAQGSSILFEGTYEQKNLQQLVIDLPFWNNIEIGMLYFEISAIEESTIQGFHYQTSDAVINPVKLGIVITHFNRQDYIIPAINRLKNTLIKDPGYQDKVSLIIVDNSQNLPVIDDVVIIKNANLGGAGGFTRGLLYLKDHAEFTHCLFMDDDASCEVESIKRTLAIFQFATDIKTAISGAMLTEREVNRQYESGAYFYGTCKSVDKGLNMLYKSDLIKNERPKRVEYGAWWFFAFDLRGVEHNAFPYFVRGDDISFSYANHLKVETLNGICSWQPDFGAKSSPQTIYLDVRNHLMHPLHGFIKGNPLYSMWKSALLIYMYQAVSYFYDSAAAVNLAIEDVLKGPDFWRNNVDMVEKRAQINAFITTEKPVAIPENIYSDGVVAKIETIATVNISDQKRVIFKPSSLVRYLTLNGHLIPTVFFHHDFTWLRKSLGSRMSSVFRYKEAIFLIDGQDKCLVLKHSKKRFFAETFRFFKLMFKLSMNYKSLQQVYVDSYAELTSDEFWRHQFEQKENMEKSK